MWRLFWVVVFLGAAAVGYFTGLVTAQTRLVTPDEVNRVEVANRTLPAVVTVIAKIAPEVLQPGEPENFTSSGFFYRNNLIVTNYHAVSGDVVGVSVQLRDGRILPATIYAVDEGVDLALLQVSGVQAPATLRFGNSADLLPGQTLMVFGAPFEKRNNVSAGVFGSMNRVEPPEGDTATEIPEMILTDANIQSGNSGGPVVDTRGLVVGVVDANLANAVGTAGLLGLAIPSSIVQQSVSDLEKFGVSQRGRLGVTLKDLAELDPITRRLSGLSSPQGAMVDGVPPGSPGGRAGLRGATRDRDGRLVSLGDIILRVDNQTVTNRFEVIQQVARRRPGQTVTLSVWRNRAPVVVRVPITARSR